MPTVCIDCRYVTSRPSGIGEMVAQLAARVPVLAPDLHFLLLTSPDAPGPLSTAANVSHRRVAAAANGPGTLWWLPHCTDLAGVDLFHATFNILPAGLDMPSLTTVHDLMWLESPDLCETGWSGALKARFFGHGITRALARSTALACVSEATRAAVIARQPDAASRCFVTLSGVDTGFHPVPPDPVALAALGCDPARRMVLCVGQCAPYKNHETALAAFALAAESRADLDLVLVQRRGPAAEQLLEQAEKLGLSGRVRVLRGIGREDLRLLYASAAALLHPSLCEGFGHPLAEAMACGCPVVTSNLSAMPEVTAGAALLADPRDAGALAAALGRVLDDTALAQTLRGRGLARAAELDWEGTARANLALYRRLLAVTPIRR